MLERLREAERWGRLLRRDGCIDITPDDFAALLACVEALERIRNYWEPHLGVNDILDSIAEIAAAALKPLIEELE